MAGQWERSYVQCTLARPWPRPLTPSGNKYTRLRNTDCLTSILPPTLAYLRHLSEKLLLC